MTVFKMEIDITDEAALRAAAKARALEEGISEEDWEYIRESSSDDLIMLIDPGHLPGCSIIQSSVE